MVVVLQLVVGELLSEDDVAWAQHSLDELAGSGGRFERDSERLVGGGRGFVALAAGDRSEVVTDSDTGGRRFDVDDRTATGRSDASDSAGSAVFDHHAKRSFGGGSRHDTSAGTDLYDFAEGNGGGPVGDRDDWCFVSEWHDVGFG